MSRHSASAHRSPVHHRARQSGRRWIGLAGVIAAAVAGFTALASPASAHDAPPKGTATCASYGPTYTWQITDGSTNVENTGGAAWKITFATSAGTITPGPSTTGVGDTAKGPTFTVTNIPSSAASIKITTTTHWGTAPNYTAGTYNYSATINRPAGGCDQALPVPAQPGVTDPTCTTVGSLAVPANTASVKWTTTPSYQTGDTGSFTVTATAQSGYHFSDGKTVENFPVTVGAKTTGSTCDSVLPVPAKPGVTDPTCSTVGSLAVPANTASVKWTTTPSYQSGDTGSFTVTATAQSGYHFSDGKTVENFPVTVAPKTTGTTCDVVVTPVAPAVTQATCTGTIPVPADIVAATTDHISYAVAPKGYHAGDTVVVTAVAASGYKFGNSQGDLPAGWIYVSPTQVTESVKLADAPVCPTLVAPIAPSIDQSACTGPGTHSSATLTIPAKDGIVYTIDGKDVSGQTLTELPNTSVTVVATPATGHLFDAVQEVDYHETFADAGDCLVLTTPVAPTSTDGACTTPGNHSDASLTIPSTPHVVYSIDGTDVSGQTLSEPVNSTVTVVATPAAGYKFDGLQSVSTVVTLADPGNCLVDTTPAAPSITQASCTGPGTNTAAALVIPTTTGVIYQIDGKDVSGTIAEPKATTVTVTAIAVSGYEFAEGTTTSWIENFSDVGGCLVGTSVAKPSFTDATCTTTKPVAASYTIPASKNVSYEVDGSPVKAGTYSATANSTITVTATADSGYSLNGAASSWTHSFGATPACEGKDAQQVHKPTTVVHDPAGPSALASTGVPTATLVLGGSIVLLLGIGLLLAGGVRGRKARG